MLTSQTLTTWERPGITSLALMYSWVHRFFQTANESVTPTMTGLYPADYSTISGLALFPRTANDHLVSATMVKKFTSQTSNVKGFLWTCLLFYRLRDELKLMSVVIDSLTQMLSIVLNTEPYTWRSAIDKWFLALQIMQNKTKSMFYATQANWKYMLVAPFL